MASAIFSANKGLLTTVAWNDCHQAMIARTPLLIHCMLRNKLNQFGTMYLRFNSQHPSYARNIPACWLLHWLTGGNLLALLPRPSRNHQQSTTNTNITNLCSKHADCQRRAYVVNIQYQRRRKNPRWIKSYDW